MTKRKISTNSRILKDTFTKYQNTFYAFKELINNAIQADANVIEIDFLNSGKDSLLLETISKIKIKDNGHGIPIGEFDNTILEVATESKDSGEGIGRFGALQIGREIRIETIGYDRDIDKFTKVIFPLSTSQLDGNLDSLELSTTDEVLEGSFNTYYEVEISNLYHNESQKTKRNKLSIDFKPDILPYSLFESYPQLIFDGKLTFIINGRKYKKSDFIEEEPKLINRVYTAVDGVKHDVQFTFYKVKLKKGEVKVSLYVNNSDFKTVGHSFAYTSDYYTSDLGSWYVYLDSAFFNSDLFRNVDLASLGEKEWNLLRDFIKDEVNNFFKNKNSKFTKFLDKLNNDTSYSKIKERPKSQGQDSLFKKTAYLLEQEHKLLETQNKLKGIIYPLVNRAIEDGQYQVILEEVLNLKPETKEQLYELIKKTDLENVIHFSSNVAEKLEFLDFLNQIVYGDISKVIKERSQLHKIVEKHLWLFGEAYNSTTNLWSDKSLGNIITDIRNKHMNYEVSEEHDNLIKVEGDGLNDITDLFFFNDKIGDGEVREIMIVELKSPICSISQKELNQIDKYAFTIDQNQSLPSDKIKYKLILISSQVNKFAASKLKSARDKYRTEYTYDVKNETKNIEVQVMSWSELIENNKRKLKHLSNALHTKDLIVSEKFENEYAELITDKVKARLYKAS